VSPVLVNATVHSALLLSLGKTLVGEVPDSVLRLMGEAAKAIGRSGRRSWSVLVVVALLAGGVLAWLLGSWQPGKVPEPATPFQRSRSRDLLTSDGLSAGARRPRWASRARSRSRRPLRGCAAALYPLPHKRPGAGGAVPLQGYAPGDEGMAAPGPLSSSDGTMRYYRVLMDKDEPYRTALFAEDEIEPDV
jgi:hypothetical protein